MEENNTIYIDVRRGEEYVTGHLPGAVNISIEEDPEAVERILELAKEEKPVILYCYSTVRSTYVCTILEAKHGVRVDQLDGGLMLYQGPLES